MKKLYISYPTNGKTDEEIAAIKEKAVSETETYLDEEVEALENSIDSAGKEPLCVLGERLQLLSTADFVYFAKGYDSTREGKTEKDCADLYGIPKLVKNAWDN